MQCDIGGGNVANDEKYIAANIPLRWMIREVFRCNIGVLWDIESLQRVVGLEYQMLYPNVIISIPKLDDDSIHSTTDHSSMCTGTICTPRDGPHSLDGHEHVRGDRVYYDDDPELKDALSELFDQLKISPIWWALEFLPMKGRKQIKEDLWKEHYL